jgi:HEAT repeat protein
MKNSIASVAIAGLAAALLVSSGVALANQDQPTANPGEEKPPQKLPENVANALKELVEAAEQEPANLSGWEGPRELRFYKLREGCWNAIQLLGKSKADVDKDLLRLARSNEPLRVRYRALAVLAQRGNPEAVPLIDKMCASKDADEKYLAWLTYDQAIREKKLTPPKDVSQHVALYAAEKDKEVRERMEWFFGTAKAKAAVKPLLASVQANPARSLAAIWSLGEIGDKSAVPVLIAAYGKNLNNDYHLQALGRLATPEAVDFLIKHLGKYGAVSALFQTKSAKALPALRKHLKKLEGRKDSPIHEIAETRLAIIRLSQEDPREQLMKMVENKDENRHIRFSALRALRECDAEPYHRRILKVYTSDPDNDIKRACIWLLEQSKLQGVTEAMIDHALVFKVKSMNDVATQYSLLDALNHRLEVSLRSMEDMRAHIRKLRKEKKADGPRD